MREVVLFDNAGIGRSSGDVPYTIAGTADHALAFLDDLGLTRCDVLGYSLGGMVAQQMVLNRSSVFRRIILVGAAARGGEDIMHLEKPSLAKHFNDPPLKDYEILQRIFFTSSPASQAAGATFIARLDRRTEDREPASGSKVAQAQIAAFREWKQFNEPRFRDLRRIVQPVLVVNGVFDEMIPIRNSYFLGENLPNAVLISYPDAAPALSSNTTRHSRGRPRHSCHLILHQRPIDLGQEKNGRHPKTHGDV